MLLAASSSQSWERDALFRRSPSSQGLWDRREAGGGGRRTSFPRIPQARGRGTLGSYRPTDLAEDPKKQRKTTSVFLPPLPLGEEGRGGEGFGGHPAGHPPPTPILFTAPEPPP